MHPALTPPPALLTEVGPGAWVWDESGVDAGYGGNKVRKLAGLLPEALARGATELVTLGATGSHHVLATALHGARVGLATHAILFAQPPRPDVDAQLQRITAACASVRRVHSLGEALGRVELRVLRWRAAGRRVVAVPLGGTSVTGLAGWRDAARDVAHRVRAGELPRPERVVVAAGTGGTAAGLLAGFAAGGLHTEVVAVRVSPTRLVGSVEIRALASASLGWGAVVGPTLRVVQGLPRGYGVGDDGVLGALAHARTLGLHLEPTYTGKAFDVWWRERALGGVSWFVATAPRRP